MERQLLKWLFKTTRICLAAPFLISAPSEREYLFIAARAGPGVGLGNIWYLWQRQRVDLAGKGAAGRFRKQKGPLGPRGPSGREAVCREGVGLWHPRAFHVSCCPGGL